MEDGFVIGGIILFSIVILVIIIVIVITMSSQSNNGTQTKQTSTSTQTQTSQTLTTQKLRHTVKNQLTRTNVIVSSSRTPLVRNIEKPIKPLSTLAPKASTVPKVPTPVVPKVPTVVVKVPTYFIESDTDTDDRTDESEDDTPELLSDVTEDNETSDDEELDEFKSDPYEENRRGGFYYPIITSVKEPKVIDVIDYPVHRDGSAGGNYYLYDNGTIRVNTSPVPLKIKGVEKLEQLFVLGGYLGGLFNGTLYFATTTTTSAISFVKAKQISTFIDSDLSNLDSYVIRVNSILNREGLSVQTKRFLVLFNANGEEIERVSGYPQTSKRVYGINKNVFIDIDLIHQTATLSTDKSVLGGIIDAAINYNGSVAPLTRIRAQEDNLIQVKYVQGSPYYISG